MDNNINQNIEELEIDEATLLLLEKSYKRKVVTSVITLVVTIAAILVSFYILMGNLQINSIINTAEASYAEENYEAAFNSYNSAKETVGELNSVIPVFKRGNKAFWDEVAAFEKLNGPVECKKLLDKYYLEGKCPAEAVPYYESAKVFTKAYNEMNKKVSTEAKNFIQAYEAIKEIMETKTDYPEYIALYFQLVAAQKFEESASTQLSIYKSLQKKAPDATWLYEYEGTRTLIAAGDLNAALRLCPDDDTEESRSLRISIHRMLKEYPEAIMLYDEYRDFDIPSQELDRQRIILYALQNDARNAIDEFEKYFLNPDICESYEMIYTLQVVAIKANNFGIYEDISNYLKTNKIPASGTVLDYKTGELTLDDIFLSGESELS